MKPVKILTFPSFWLLRFSLLLVSYLFFIPQVIRFSFDGIYYFVALLFVLFSVLICMGGVSKKPHITIYSGIVLFVLSAYQCVILFDLRNISAEWVIFLITSAIAMLFISTGNKR